MCDTNPEAVLMLIDDQETQQTGLGERYEDIFSQF